MLTCFLHHRAKISGSNVDLTERVPDVHGCRNLGVLPNDT